MLPVELFDQFLQPVLLCDTSGVQRDLLMGLIGLWPTRVAMIVPVAAARWEYPYVPDGNAPGARAHAIDRCLDDRQGCRTIPECATRLKDRWNRALYGFINNALSALSVAAAGSLGIVVERHPTNPSGRTSEAPDSVSP